MILTAEPGPAARMYVLGLVSRLVEPGQAPEAAIERLRETLAAAKRRGGNRIE